MNNEKPENHSFPRYNDQKFIRELVYDAARVCYVPILGSSTPPCVEKKIAFDANCF